jgi:ABC-type phosphate transport system substrate-binding protein
MKKPHSWAAAFLLCASLATPALAGDVVVIVNKANAQAIDLTLVTRIYTGSAQSWPDGAAVTAFDQNDDAIRGQFASMIGKTPANLKAAWATLLFAGKATPPKAMASDADIKAAVSANKAAIGYIKASAVDDTVKVVAK